MPIPLPALDDRTYDDLVAELLARIPAHTPEWTNPRVGDPGVTLVQLFAWLGDTLLYRANRVPERQRLAFLRLLGEQMRPAVPARTLVTFSAERDVTAATTLRPGATVSGPVAFETLGEVTVLPVSGEWYIKRTPARDELENVQGLLDGLRALYGIDGPASPYITTPVFGAGPAAAGVDLARDAVDRCLWVALLAADDANVAALQAGLSDAESGAGRLLSVGFLPRADVPGLSEEIGARARIAHTWEMAVQNAQTGGTEYQPLDAVADSTAGLTRRGVIRLALPASGVTPAVPDQDVRRVVDAGVGDLPPRLDDLDKAERVVAWLRLRPARGVTSLVVGWAGINAVDADQRQTVLNRIAGVSDGSSRQEMALFAQSIAPDTLRLEVEEAGRGFVAWRRVDDLAQAGRDDGVFVLDAEAGVVRFGDGLRGRVPEAGARVRVSLRAGGGRAGNLPPLSLTRLGSALDLRGQPAARLKVAQPVPAEGGEDAESLDAAEQRIPALLRHRERAVTGDDYVRLAFDTPGVRVGRAEVLERFRPAQRSDDNLGVVSVLALPFAELGDGGPPPAVPVADRPFLESVYGYLDPRRPLGTELYVIGCEYVRVGLSVGVTVAEGFGREAVLKAVGDALRRFLWPLPPGGGTGKGWPRGATVRERELEVAAARVEGVSEVIGVNLFEHAGGRFRLPPRPEGNRFAPREIALEKWQLPELAGLRVVADSAPPDALLNAPSRDEGGIAVPVVPEVCR